MGKSPSTSNVKQNLTALWECLVGLQIFPNFLLSAWEWLDTEFFFICGWTSPIMLLLSLCIAEKVVRVTVFQYSFCVPNNAFLPPVCVLHLLPAQKREKKKKIQSCSMCCELSLMTLSLPPSAPLSSTTWLRGVWLCCCASREWPCSTTHPSLSETLCSSLLCHHTPFSICWSCHETNKEDKSFWVGRSNDVRMSFHHFGPGTLGRISMWYAHIW